MPLYVKDALQKLDEAGHIAYVVGGTVRDFLLKRESKDYDIATSAEPDELCVLFPKAITVGKAFGVIKLPIENHPEGHFLEIATFREDLEYRDFRHPEGVRFASPFEDAKRRDFTINALFFDPKTSRILDSVGGVEDLKAKKIRAIGNPLERFREDALRLLRAIRFSTVLEFEIEEETLKAIHERAELIKQVSSERIRDELTGMWKGPHPDQALSLLKELQLLSIVLPEFDFLMTKKEEWEHTLKLLKILAKKYPKRSVSLSWSAVLLHLNQVNPLGMKTVEKLGERLKFSNHEIQRINAIVQGHLRFREVFKMREATLERFVREPEFEEQLALHYADALALDGNLVYYEFCLSRFESAKKLASLENTKLIDGKDLIQLGFHPGPQFSEILRVVEDLALERKLHTKEEALEYVLKSFIK